MKRPVKLVLWCLAVACALAGFVVLNRRVNEFEDELRYLRRERARLRGAVADSRGEKTRLGIEIKVSRLRRLPFLRSPSSREMTRRELREKLVSELQKEYPDQTLENMRKVLVKFGFLDPGYDLNSALLALYEEQVGAFYDVEARVLYRIKGLALGRGLENAVLAHELTHALQDQHFDVKSLLSKKMDDDGKLARSALVEGDATFVTQLFYIRSLNFSFLWDLISIFFIDQSQFKQAPLVIRDNLTFPYLQGMEFIVYVYQRGGWSAVNACFRNPPASSEHILHPQKYLSRQDPPRMLSISRSGMIRARYKRLERNALGEFNTGLLFRKFLGRGADPAFWHGWGGDIYEVWQEKRGRDVLLIWLSAWDSGQDTAEFFEGYLRLAGVKHGDVEVIRGDADERLWKSSNEWIWVKKTQDRVIVAETRRKTTLEEVMKLF